MPAITSKGQVTIPKKIRDKFGLKPSDRVEFKIEKGKVVLSFDKGTILDAIRKPERPSPAATKGNQRKKGKNISKPGKD